MKYKGYDIEPKFINPETGKIDWTVWHTPNGSMIIGVKDGKKYLIKRNANVMRPSSDLPEESRRVFQETVDRHTSKQAKLKNLMKSLSMEANHIVNELDHFWDEEGLFTTVTRLVPGVLPDETDFSSLSREQFISLLKKSISFLVDLHNCGVIHGDLKTKNIVLTKEGSELVPYLIDFDSSYPASEIPDWDKIVGTDGYRSPELSLYSYDEGMAEPSVMTYATDVFTLAIIWHIWWTGLFPTVAEDGLYVGEAICTDVAVEINKKFDVKIGDTCGATLISLINWMFEKDFSKRPTAKDVLSVLNDEIAVPVDYHIGADAKPFDTEVWSAHKLAATLISVDSLKAMGLKSFKRINVGGGASGYKYQAIMADGSEKVLTLDEICELGYATRIAAKISDTWPDDRIEFEDPMVLSAKGIAKIEKVVLFFKKRYNITTISGRTYDKGAEWLVANGYAHPVVVSIDSDTPWPEHGSAYNKERISAAGIVKITRAEVGGEKRYDYVKADGSEVKGAPAKNLIFMGFIVR